MLNKSLKSDTLRLCTKPPHVTGDSPELMTLATCTMTRANVSLQSFPRMQKSVSKEKLTAVECTSKKAHISHTIYYLFDWWYSTNFVII